MRTARWNAILLVAGITLSIVGCGGSGNSFISPPATATYTLTVNSTTPATGVAITVSPADNNSAANGATSFTRTYNSGTAVTLTAPATSSGNTFASWTGCTSASGAACTVTMSANATVTANYTAPTTPAAYTLTVNSTNPASGVAITASPSDNNGLTSGSTSFTLNYNSGTVVTLTAPATSGGNAFSSWTGCTSTSTVTCSVTLTANATVTANYAASVTPPTTTYTLTVDSTDPASGVAITVSPADNTNAGNGTTSFTRTYNSGAAVTLTAPATSGSNNFASWTGCTTTSTTTCNVTLSANTVVKVNYTPPPTYTLTVTSTNPTSGISVSVSPADNTGKTTGSTSFDLTYSTGASVTLTAPATYEGSNFTSWTGCASTSGLTCTVTMNANTTVAANFPAPAITSVTVTPNPSTVVIGTTQLFAAAVAGTGSDSTATGVTWSVAAPAGSSDSAGTISSTGLYTTPYPAPATVTVTATSTTDTTRSGSVVVTLAAPATAPGPTLSVDAGTPTHAINPNIYGMNAYQLDSTTATNANITVARWGGDDTSRYNYQTNVVNSAADYYFENFTGSNSMLGGGLFNNFVTTADGLGIQTIGAAPMIGWVSNSTVGACSFTEAAYPGQQEYIASASGSGTNCGNGVESNGTDLNGTSPGNTNTTPTLTSVAEPAPTPPASAASVTSTWADSTWIGGWVNCLVTEGSYCAATGGKDVTIWDMDNEPEYWSAVHRDVHPNPMTYSEITNDGIGTALAIKTADPNALTSGPIISGWYNYFYSEQDVDNGYSTGPCYEPWDDPTDRTSHGGLPFIEYYLQQMAAASTNLFGGKRLLDYVDVHAYFAANYNGTSTGLTTAGNTAEQQARMNSTRVFWDPTYTDPDLPQPNYPNLDNGQPDPAYTTSCTTPLVAPELIPRMQGWTTYYPGTMTSIDEYNFGGNESINGAVTQADVLGIFGQYGLDMATLWPTQAFNTQGPGNEAFEIYRNYDGAKSTFGNMALTSASTAQGSLSVYGGIRSATDNAITIVVINKTYGPLTSTLSLENFNPGSPVNATPYLYSNANLTAIVAQTPIAVTPPASGTTSTLSYTFPAQSITLFVIPN